MVAAARAALCPTRSSRPPRSRASTPARPTPAGATRVNPPRRSATAGRGAAAGAPTARRHFPLPSAADERSGPPPAPPAARARPPPPRARGPFLARQRPLMRRGRRRRRVIGQGGGDDTAPPTAGSRATTISSWPTRRTGRPAARPTPSAALQLTSPIALRTASARIVAGRIAAPAPGLLPRRRRRRAPDDVVSLDRTPALRHTGVPAGGASATVFVVSTDDGPQAIACVGASPKGCEGVAATLKLQTGDALDIRPDRTTRRR